MVGIVVVSHSDVLAQAVVTLAREMGGAELALEPAGGTEEPGVLGTDAERIRGAIERAMSGDGVVVLMDLGSALMSTEFAIGLIGEAGDKVLMSEAPLVEGAVAAAVAAAGGGTLEEVAAEARGALAMKAAQLSAENGVTATTAGPLTATPADAEASILVRNAIGLHARPAARFVETARGFDAEVAVAKAGAGPPVRASSLTNVVSLGARVGDTLLVSASGPEAGAAVAALEALAAEGFGDGIAPGPPPAGSAAAGQAGGRPSAAPPTARSTPAAPAPPDSGAVLSGVAASPGIAEAPAHHLHGAFEPPPERAPDTPEHERARLHEGIAAARSAIMRDRQVVTRRAGQAEAAIFDAHLALLDDEAMLEPANAEIDAGATAERAWHDAAKGVAERFLGLDQELLRERAADVLDVGRRVVEALTGEQTSGPERAAIVLVGELTPADAAALDPAVVRGIATAHGTATAHAAILARALGVPAVVGLTEAVLGIEEGTPLLLDGEAGTLEVDPPPDALRDARDRRERAERRRVLARERAQEPGVTRDGTRIEVFANLGSSGEVAQAVQLGAEGVGLLRTEFLFLGRAELPDEEEQTETLRQIARGLEGRPLVVRTLDAGADKPLPALPMPEEANPFLGVRGIRLTLERRDVLATQLRAVLRVAAEHPVKVMLPMVATLDEVHAARAVLAQARAATGIDAPLQLGIMVEVPAAALTARRLAEHVDFFSIGTNDLTQYTMAAARDEERLAPLLAGPQPAVLRLIQATVHAARERGRWVGVCGELAGDPPTAVLLVGLGVTELSMAPALVPEVKAALRELELGPASAAAEAALEADSGTAARSLGADLL
jgi:multiphosphoryl transfer protein